ncbi:MAG TPA: rhomboid family intramembrane serine protease [Methylomirabilota bacterium]|nr:rhomboid family intramembrane serine protease [Methylomirabilota bacterium]
MIPLKDDVPTSSTPFVTIVLIALNALVYVYQISLAFDTRGPGAGAYQAFIVEFGLVPCRLSGSCAGFEDFPSPAMTMFSSMFLHAGLEHIGSNMLFLWIFGDSVEDTLGHGRFLLLYLAAGVAGALLHVGLTPGSRVPVVGASGAISGVLGAYIVLFPYARVLTLLILGFLIRFIHIPAMVVLGFWFLMQLLFATISFSAQAAGRAESGGPAWFVHIGGFLAGILLLLMLRPRRSTRL